LSENSEYASKIETYKLGFEKERKKEIEMIVERMQEEVISKQLQLERASKKIDFEFEKKKRVEWTIFRTKETDYVNSINSLNTQVNMLETFVKELKLKLTSKDDLLVQHQQSIIPLLTSKIRDKDDQMQEKDTVITGMKGDITAMRDALRRENARSMEKIVGLKREYKEKEKKILSEIQAFKDLHATKIDELFFVLYFFFFFFYYMCARID